MPVNKVQFVANVPVEVALKYADGKQVDGAFGEQVYYSLSYSSDGAPGMYVDPLVAAKIRAAEVRPNEKFWLCKRRGAGRGAAVVWDVWRDNKATMESRISPGDSQLTRDLARSIDHVNTTRNGHGELVVPTETAAGNRNWGASVSPAADALHKKEPETVPASLAAQRPSALAIHGSVPKENGVILQACALVDAMAAVLDHAQQYGQVISREDVRSLVVTSFINLAGGKPGRNAA